MTTKLTKEQGAIISAFTGILVGKFSDFTEYAEHILDRPIWTHQYPGLSAQIKEAVIREEKSVKGEHYHAVYVRGRVSWNSDMLDGMIVAFPALEKARKVGAPSVTIRRIS